jgi:hypothetical protein
MCYADTSDDSDFCDISDNKPPATVHAWKKKIIVTIHCFNGAIEILVQKFTNSSVIIQEFQVLQNKSLFNSFGFFQTIFSP